MKVFVFTLRRLDGKTRTATIKANDCTIALLVAIKECYEDDICEVKLVMEHAENFKDWNLRK